MAGDYYNRREDETPGAVADDAFAQLVQLFVPFSYNEQEKSFKKNVYFFIDRELFAYTDVIKLSFHKTDSRDPPEISDSEAVTYRFATGYFLHCMVNRKLSSCRREFHELAGTYPDTFLLDELFRAANNCCNSHTEQEWLKGTRFITKDGKYLKNAFLRVNDRMKTEVFNAARTSSFTLRDLSGCYEYNWRGIRHREDGVCIEISIAHPLEKYDRFEEMVKGLIRNWGDRFLESFREEVLEEYRKKLNDKEKKRLAVRGGSLEISDISMKFSESFFWSLLGLKRRSAVISHRCCTDLELMLFTLSLGENLHTYQQLCILRNKEYGVVVDNAEEVETEALKNILLNFLHLGPERYLRAIERVKALFRAGVSSGSIRAERNKMAVPNLPRMVVINIALDRYLSGLEEIRRAREGGNDELIRMFREAFLKTEVKKLRLITKEEIEMLLDNDRSLRAEKEDLKELKDAM
ncbi:MAG: hypothetical protein Q4D81_05755 [Eubacteriales bacterium]|nr:hypothetical protein [Eubacteriales bacterium]